MDYLDKALFKPLIRMSLPVMGGMLSSTLINAVDTAFVGRLGAAQLTATGIGGLAYISLALTLGSLAVGLQAMAARRFGEGDFAGAGRVAMNALWIGIPAGLLFCVLGVLAAPYMARVLFVSPEARPFGADYLAWRMPGLVFFMYVAVLRGFFNAVGKTRYFLYSSIVSASLNAVLAYALIFGHFGLPRLEVKGAAIASLIAEGTGALCFAFFSLKPHERRRFNLYRFFRVEWPAVGSLVRLSAPAAVRMLLDIGSFLVFFWIISLVGTTEAAAANIIRSIMGLCFLLLFGLSVGASAMLGQYLGAKSPLLAERTAHEAIKVGLVCMVVLGAVALAAPASLLSVYTNDPEVIMTGVWPLRINTIGMMMAPIGIVLSSCLNGAGDTRYVMFITLPVILVFYIPCTWLCAITLKWGIAGAYLNEMLYWVFVGLLCYFRFRQGRWKEIVL